MTLEEAEAWRSRKRAGTERPGGRVVVRSDRGGSVLHVEASGREPFEVYPGKVEFLGGEVYDVAVTVEVVDSGDEAPTVDVTEVAFRARPDGRPLSARGIQAVNVGALMGRAVDALGEAVDSEGQRVKVAAGEHLRRAMARSATTANRGRPSTSVADQALDEASETNRSRGRPVSVTTDAYEAAARLYRAAQASGTSTTAAVADGLAVSRSTARKRVMGARKRGLLPVAESTRPRL